MNWREEAACAGNSRPLWDETVDGETRAQQAARHKEAKAICRKCPSTSPCWADVDWAIDEGVRGGRLLPWKKTAFRPRADWPVYAQAAS